MTSFATNNKYLKNLLILKKVTGASLKLALTKTDIAEKITQRNNLKPPEAKDTIENLLEIMKSTLASGEDIMISGFGKFQVNDKAPRKGRNPATGQEMMIDGRRTVTFKCAGGLRDRINVGLVKVD